MDPVIQADIRRRPPWSLRRLLGLLPALACLSACTADLSPSETLLAQHMPIEDSASSQLVIESPSRAPVLITVAGHDVDIRAAVAGADGGVPAFADAPNRRMGVETLLVEAGHPGRITLQIERNDHAGARGTAEVTVRSLPVASESDQGRLQAARNEAFACLTFPDLKRGQESADAFEKAAVLHAQNDDRRQEGMARLQAAGVRYTRLSDWPGAARLASKAAPLLARSEAPSYAAFAARLEGAALDQRANSSVVAAGGRNRYLARARERLAEAAEQFKALGNHYEAGYALNYRGVSYDVTGDRDRARKDFLAALDLFRKAADPPAQALSLQSLATQSYLEGRLSDAMIEFDQALALIPRDSDPENFAHTLNNSAWPLRAVGRFDDATARFHEAGEILYRLGDRDGQARALHGLATTLMQTGETDRAKELLLAAIQLRGETGARREQAISLLALGELERRDNKLQDAISHERRALGLVDAPHDVAQGKLFLSRAYRADRQLGLARQQLEDILRLQLPATHLYRGLALGELGIVESLAGSPDASRAHFDQALAALKANGSDVEHARTLVQRAEARLRSHETAGAVADARTAVVELESIGLQSLQAENRAAFRASYRDAVEVQIGALLKDAETERKKGNDARTQELFRSAWVVSDHGRSQLLVGTGRLPGMPVSEQVMSRRRQVYESLAGKRQQRERLYGSAHPDENRITKLTREIAQLRTEASQLDARVSEHEPALGRRERRRTPVDEAIRSMQDSVVAEYFIGRDYAWLFVLSNGRTAAFRLASAREIEARARKVHSAWRQYNHSSADRLNDAAAIASELFRNVPSPAVGGLLYVIPDGVLHVVPMAVLARQAIPGLQPGSVQIATALAAVLDRPPSEDNGERQLLAVVADPVYSADDARLGRAASRSRAVAAEPGLTRYSQVPARVRRLPSTTIEARAIATLAGESQAPFQLIGPDATRRNVLNARLDRFRIIHFAAHAFADSQDSGLATIALSRFDRDGKPLDGDLRAFDIAQLRLSAELVVLSACNTAVGREIAGEAPLGLSHAFLQGGAQSVVATLWQVPDSSTARLMEVFYRELLVNRRSPAEALELAQGSIRKLPRWSDPYFWAGFQLVSNARFEVGNKNVARREG